jgi:hypothetical protein
MSMAGPGSLIYKIYLSLGNWVIGVLDVGDISAFYHSSIRSFTQSITDNQFIVAGINPFFPIRQYSF